MEHDPDAIRAADDVIAEAAELKELVVPDLPYVSTPALSVHADIIDLLDHFHGNEQDTFEFLGKLKDLLA